MNGGYFVGKREVIGGKPKCYFSSSSSSELCASSGEGEYTKRFERGFLNGAKRRISLISEREPTSVYLW